MSNNATAASRNAAKLRIVRRTAKFDTSGWVDR